MPEPEGTTPVGKMPEPDGMTPVGKTPEPEAETDGKIPLPLAEIEGNPVPVDTGDWETGAPLTLDDTPEPEANGGATEPPDTVV